MLKSFAISPAQTTENERFALYGMLKHSNLEGISLLADKGYRGDIIDNVKQEYNVDLLVLENEAPLLLKQKRQLIETVFKQFKDDFSLEKLRTKSQEGLFVRILARVLAFTLAIYVNILNGDSLLCLTNFNC